MEYTVLNPFSDVHTGELHKIGTIIELTDDRFNEIAENATVYGGVDTFLKVAEKTTENKKQRKTVKK